MNERVDEWWCVKAIKAMRESVGGKKIPCSVMVDKVLFYVPQAGSVASLMGFASAHGTCYTKCTSLLDFWSNDIPIFSTKSRIHSLNG